MIVSPVPCSIDSLVAHDAPPRSTGLHVSQIIRSLLQTLDKKRYQDAGVSDEEIARRTARFEAGFTLERALELAFITRRKDQIFRPGEITKDGVICSPDGIDVASFAVEEYKHTWKSSIGCPTDDKFISWRWQVAAYCHVIGTRTAYLRVLFVNGDYRSGYQPQFKAWRLQFSRVELEQNWAMLVGHAREKGWLA